MQTHVFFTCASFSVKGNSNVNGNLWPIKDSICSLMVKGGGDPIYSSLNSIQKSKLGVTKKYFITFHPFILICESRVFIYSYK